MKFRLLFLTSFLIVFLAGGNAFADEKPGVLAGLDVLDQINIQSIESVVVSRKGSQFTAAVTLLFTNAAIMDARIRNGDFTVALTQGEERVDIGRVQVPELVIPAAAKGKPGESTVTLEAPIEGEPEEIIGRLARLFAMIAGKPKSPLTLPLEGKAALGMKAGAAGWFEMEDLRLELAFETRLAEAFSFCYRNVVPAKAPPAN